MANNPPSFPAAGRSSLSPEYQRDWPEYYAAVEGKPPRDTMLRALGFFAKEPCPDSIPTAIDVGCGSGRDSLELLRQGWRVWATDSHTDSRRLTLARVPPHAGERLVFVLCPMEELPAESQLPPRVDLVNASFALPFCKPERFDALWGWIGRVVRPGGRFAGQFFGDRDEWKCVRPKSHFTRSEFEQLFARWTIEHLEEVEKEGDDATGRPKYHHVFHVVARNSKPT